MQRAFALFLQGVAQLIDQRQRYRANILLTGYRFGKTALGAIDRQGQARRNRLLQLPERLPQAGKKLRAKARREGRTRA